MTAVYRYLRPLAYDFKRSEEVTQLRGGICFRVEDAAPDMYEVSYSICHADELFNKSVAKLLADERYKNGVYVHLPKDSPLALWYQMQKLAGQVGQDSLTNDDAFEFYKRLELSVLEKRIREIRRTHEQVQQIRSLDRDVIEALNFRELYENQAR